MIWKSEKADYVIYDQYGWQLPGHLVSPAIDAKHEAWLEAQRAAEAAEKAAADKVAEQMKIEAEKAKDEAVAARLSEKFNVKTKKR